MKIFCYDDDPRLKSEGESYYQNMGSFGQILWNLNKELKKTNILGDENDTDAVVFSSGLKWEFGFEDKIRLLINVWECNILPHVLINFRKRLENERYIVCGLSKQIADVWSNYGFPTKTIDIGCDTEFWCPQQQIKKFDDFTILSNICLNFRSGIQHVLQAYMSLWADDKSVRLIIKNTDDRAKKIPIFVEKMKKKGMNVEYICKRMDLTEMRELITKCHVLTYCPNNTSAGLCIPEASAMEIPVITCDYCPTNLYPSCEKVMVSRMELGQFKEIVSNYWGLPVNFPDGWIDERLAYINWLDGADFYEKLSKIKNNYDFYAQKAKVCRQEVIDNWSWKHSLNQLLDALEK